MDTPPRDVAAPSEPLFDADFAAKFPTRGALELEEAATCLALGRATAAVFHLMRLTEIGIEATATCLGMRDPLEAGERTWERVLHEIRGELDARGKRALGRAWKTSGDAAWFEGIHAALAAIGVAWRDPAIQVGNHHTPDQAERIFLAVRGFLRKLADCCDENGLPAA